jgi:hypothetical protein
VENTSATQSLISGVVSSANHGDGVRIAPGSNVKVRGSSLLNNAGSGIHVENSNPAITNTALGNIDLGTATSGTAAGGNVLQGTPSNQQAGLCLVLPPGTKGDTLNAMGNTFSKGACTSTGPVLVTTSGDPCSGAVDVGGSIAADVNKIYVSGCSYQ